MPYTITIALALAGVAAILSVTFSIREHLAAVRRGAQLRKRLAELNARRDERRRAMLQSLADIGANALATGYVLPLPTEQRFLDDVPADVPNWRDYAA